jgi:hypothetical protein
MENNKLPIEISELAKKAPEVSIAGAATVAGATIGTFFCPGLGTGVGAGIGAICGGVGAIIHAVKKNKSNSEKD